MEQKVIVERAINFNEFSSVANVLDIWRSQYLMIERTTNERLVQEFYSSLIEESKYIYKVYVRGV